MTSFLKECAKYTKKETKHNPLTPIGLKNILVDDNHWNIYKESLCSDIKKSDRGQFNMLAENTRRVLMENSMFQLNPYEVFALPVLRVAYPNLIAKDLVTVEAMQAPEIVKQFLVPTITDYTGLKKTLPNLDPNVDFTKGPLVGHTSTANAPVGASTDILAAAPGGLTPAIAHVQKDLIIYKVYDSAANFALVNITATVDGLFMQKVTINGVDDVIYGSIDYFNGILTLASQNGIAVSADYRCSISLEENKINPKVNFDFIKERIVAIDREVSVEWSIQMEQDAKVLFDLDFQKEVVDILGKELAIAIDKEIISEILNANATLNPSSHTAAFSTAVPSGYTLGPKAWLENIIIQLNKLSATIYNDIRFGSANTIACNPIDAAYFEDIQGFDYVGDHVAGGSYGPRQATIKGKWNVLVSPVVPEGRVPVVYKPDNISQAIYYYGSYVPAVITPYPLGPKPSLTVLSRYGKKFLRPLGVGELTIS